VTSVWTLLGQGFGFRSASSPVKSYVVGPLTFQSVALRYGSHVDLLIVLIIGQCQSKSVEIETEHCILYTQLAVEYIMMCFVYYTYKRVSHSRVYYSQIGYHSLLLQLHGCLHPLQCDCDVASVIIGPLFSKLLVRLM